MQEERGLLARPDSNMDANKRQHIIREIITLLSNNNMTVKETRSIFACVLDEIEMKNIISL